MTYLVGYLTIGKGKFPPYEAGPNLSSNQQGDTETYILHQRNQSKSGYDVGDSHAQQSAEAYRFCKNF